MNQGWSVRISIILAALAVCIAGVALGVSLTRSTTSATAPHHTTLVAMPKTVGMAEASALHLLRHDGFRVKVASAHSKAVPRGSVLTVRPRTGSRVPRGTLVTLTVSSGPATKKK